MNSNVKSTKGLVGEVKNFNDFLDTFKSGVFRAGDKMTDKGGDRFMLLLEDHVWNAYPYLAVNLKSGAVVAISEVVFPVAVERMA